ncbi:MAG: glycogen/starch/alpha-glucan phosphorylase, partial [Rhodoferax sp.]|nr:glycogen/starch/alpha-glucan phosphorylase [Rhodoferax sp.]
MAAWQERTKDLRVSKRDSKLPASLGVAIGEQLLKTVAVDARHASDNELVQAVSQVARAQLSQRWVENDARERNSRARRVYYLSMEFLVGRSLSNALGALELDEPARAGLKEYARTLEDLCDHEPDAALGNGGLGRLAACFLDSMATVGLPSYGYGIRYEYGMFAQEIQGGNQMEYPDPWLKDGTPWEFPRSERAYPVRFGGWVEHVNGSVSWRHAAEVVAKAYDMVIPGHGNRKVSTLRLWKAAAPAHIDLGAFNTGDYARAAGAKNEYE